MDGNRALQAPTLWKAAPRFVWPLLKSRVSKPVAMCPWCWFGAGVLEQELSALAWLRFPIPTLCCNLAHVVPEGFAEGRVR